MELDKDLLASIASGGLGHWYDDGAGGQSYVKDDDCIACLKDLQGFFRFDNPIERPAFFEVSKYNLSRSDLVPLIVTYPEDYDVVYNALKVCVFLTMPSPEQETANPAKQAAYMQQVCDAFLAQDALAVIVGLLADPLSRHPKMTDKDTALVELVITFLRNLMGATIPPAGAGGMQEEAGRRVRTGMLERLFADDVMDLVLLMAQHARERPFKSQANVLLELFLAMFTDVTPEVLLKADETLAALEEDSIRAEAAAKKRAQAQRPRPPVARGPITMPQPKKGKTIISKGPSRTQYAAAVFTRRHMDHGADVLVRHTHAAKELPAMDTFTDSKHRKAQAKEMESGRLSAPSLPGVVRLRMAHLSAKLNTYLSTFLQEAYTPLVGQVFKDIKSGLGVSMLEEDDFERFVRFVAFCTQYARLKEESRLQRRMEAARNGGGSADVAEDEEDADRSPFECLSSTMGWDGFHSMLVLIQIARDREVQRTKDKNLKNIPRKNVLLNSVGHLIKEMLLTLDLARFVGNSADRHAADRLQRRLAFDESKDSGVLKIILWMIRTFSFASHSREHAVNMADVLHIVLGMLERLTKDPSGLMVRQQVRQRARRASNAEGGTQPTQGGAPGVEQNSGEEKDSGNAEAGDPSPGGGGGSTDGTAAEVLDLAGTTDGTTDPDGEDPTPDAAKQQGAVRKEQQAGARYDDEDDPNYILPLVTNPERPSNQAPAYKDKPFDLEKQLRLYYATPAVIQFHMWLLEGYRTNTAFTNAAITSCLNRISGPKEKGGLGLHTLLWQLSVLRIFHTIMSDPAVRANPQQADLLKLCVRITRGLFARLVPEDVVEPQPGSDKAMFEGDEFGADRDVSDGGAPGEELEGEALRKKQIADLEPIMKEKCASMGFIELLFWKKNEVTAEALAEEYNWKARKRENTLLQMRNDGVPQGAYTGKDGQLGFASYKASAKAPDFTEDETNQLMVAFERCNGYKDCLERLVDEFDGRIKKSKISKKMKDLGLYRGKFTYNQQERMRELLEEHADMGPKSKFAAIAEDLRAGFTGNQVKRKLRDLGLVLGSGGARGRASGGGKSRGGKKSAADAWAALLGSEDEGEGAAGGSGGGGGGRRGGGDGIASDSSDSDRSSSDEESEASDGDSDDEGNEMRNTKTTTNNKKKNSSHAAVAPTEVPSFDEIMLGEAPASPGGLEIVDDGEDDDDHSVKELGEGSGQKRRASEDLEEGHARGGGGGGPGHKLRRRSDDNGRATTEDDETEQRRAAALALLRKKYKPSAAEEAAQKAVDEAEAGAEDEAQLMEQEVLEPAAPAEPMGNEEEDDMEEQKENAGVAGPASEPVKTFGRRLKRLGGGETAAAALPSIFDDLEDF